MRKGSGKATRLCYGAHALMENRSELLIDLEVSQATGTSWWVGAAYDLLRMAKFLPQQA